MARGRSGLRRHAFGVPVRLFPGKPPLARGDPSIICVRESTEVSPSAPSPRGHLIPYCDLLRSWQMSRRNGKDNLILHADVFPIHACKIRNRFAKALDFCLRQASSGEIHLPQSLHFRMQWSRPTMFFLEFFEFRYRGLNFRIANLSHSRKQRLFFIGVMLWRGFPEVAQSGIERPSRFLRQRPIDDLRHGLERAEEHLNPPMAVGKKSRRIRKVVNARPDLNRHHSTSQSTGPYPGCNMLPCPHVFANEKSHKHDVAQPLVAAAFP